MPGVTLIVDVPVFSMMAAQGLGGAALALPRKLTVPPLRIRPLALPRLVPLLVPVLIQRKRTALVDDDVRQDSSAPAPFRVKVPPLTMVLPL